MQRLKITLKNRVYRELLSDISRANKDLRDFTHQSLALEPIKRTRRSRRSVAELKLIRRYATSLYHVLMTDRAWRCSCKTYHKASLRLEARPQTMEGLKVGVPQEHVFRVLISVADVTGTSNTILQWREIEVVPSLETQAPFQALETHCSVPK